MKHLVMHFTIFWVIISGIIRWFGLVNIRGAGCVQVACVLCFSIAILRTSCWPPWGLMVLFLCLPRMHTNLQDTQTEPVNLCMVAHGLHTVHSIPLVPNQASYCVLLLSPTSSRHPLRCDLCHFPHLAPLLAFISVRTNASLESARSNG